MRVVCERCGVQSMLLDDRIYQGGVNVCCSQCGSTQHLDQSQIPSSYMDAVWYVVLNGEQVGPVSMYDIEMYTYNQQLGGDSYVWRDGLSDWVQFASIPEFEYMFHLSQVSESLEATRMSEMPMSDGSYESTTALPNYYQQNEAMKSSNSSNGYASFDSMGSGFGSSDSNFQNFDAGFSSSDDDDSSNDLFGSANDLVGARSENSVLFSLSNLQAVSARVTKGNTSLPVTEGSGLIDVKALATNQDGPQVRRRSFEQESYDAMVPAAAMLPLGTRRSNTGLIIAIVSGVAFVVIILIVVVVVLLTRDNKGPVQSSEVKVADVGDLGVLPTNSMVAQNVNVGNPTAQAPSQGAVAVDAGGTDTKGDGATAPTGQQQQNDSQAAAPVQGDSQAEEAKPAEEEKVEENKKGSRRARGDRNKGDVEKKEESKPVAEEPVKVADKKKAATPPKPEPKKDSAGGNALTRDEVQQVIRSNVNKVKTCGKVSNITDPVKVSFVIRGDGRVGNTKLLTPSYVGKPAGTCVTKVINEMRFRASGGKDVPVTYTF